MTQRRPHTAPSGRTASGRAPVVRPPAVAGRFYPGDAHSLRAEVGVHVARGRAVAGRRPEGRLLALVVPHAGYVYSGPVAGCAYAAITAVERRRIRRVLLLGPAHYVFVDGLAVTAADVWQTPLGPVTIAADARRRLVDAGVPVDDEPHRPEHSLEVQLPFLQEVLPDAEVLPVLVGRCPPGPVADLVTDTWAGTDTLVVVSTDLSHYLPLPEARARDQATADAIERADAFAVADDDACGARPLRGLLQAAAQRRAQIGRLALASSADTIGPPERVVGYGAFAVVDAGPGPSA